MCGKSFYEENLGNINLSLHRLQSIDHINNTLLHLRTKNFCKKCDTLLATEIALRALKKLPPI